MTFSDAILSTQHTKHVAAKIIELRRRQRQRLCVSGFDEFFVQRTLSGGGCNYVLVAGG